MYDVFLSHNRLQKPWVRELYSFLISQGLKVFFDEESILPGQNIVVAIEEALATSRHVVLIISRSSLASKWVAMESQLSVHDDPDATKRKIVPVIIESIDFRKARLSLQTLNCIDLSRSHTREDRLRFMLKHIGIRNIDDIEAKDLSQLLSLTLVSEPDTLMVGSVHDVLNWGWDGIRCPSREKR